MNRPEPPKWEYAIQSDTSRRYESGYRVLRELFDQKDAEIARLNGHLAMLREIIDGNCVDKKNGKG